MKTGKNLNVVISCSTKFHAFAMAEQFERLGYLHAFYTSFASFKNTFFRKFVSRLDNEKIEVTRIKTNLLIAILHKLFSTYPHFWNELFDRWVAFRLKRNPDFDVFIGWSGMSLHSIKQAKKMGKITIVERGSSHILYQNEILKEEYAKFGIPFSIHSSVIAKELKEYEEADYISIPSSFVKNSFINKGVHEDKIIQNPYGVELKNFYSKREVVGISIPIKILYLGNQSFRKGLPYLFEAINSLNKDKFIFEFHFIGTISPDFQNYFNQNKNPNWIMHGHLPQHELKNELPNFDMAIHPSLEEGLSMVISQLLACGIPVIATTNTGGEELIKDGYNGYIVPIRNSEAIKEKMELLLNDTNKLIAMKLNAIESVKDGFTWNHYGNRWQENLEKIT
jgi:glycosyltransferase involved in cell wall biosynthesis